MAYFSVASLSGVRKSKRHVFEVPYDLEDFTLTCTANRTRSRHLNWLPTYKQDRIGRSCDGKSNLCLQDKSYDGTRLVLRFYHISELSVGKYRCVSLSVPASVGKSVATAVTILVYSKMSAMLRVCLQFLRPLL